MSVGTYADEAYMSNPQEFCDIFATKNKEALEKDDPETKVV